MKLLITCAVLGIPVLFLIGCVATRAGYESASYTVVESDGDFEIRQYPDLVVASTNMQTDQLESDGSFMRLFRYISGDNEDDEKISMTTPVFTSEAEKGGREMSFVVPEEVARAGAPNPISQDVRVQTLQGGRFAVYRFSGSWDAEKRDAAEEKLTSWMKGQGLVAAGELQTANYDPPFTPPFLRRNEVMYRIQAK